MDEYNYPEPDLSQVQMIQDLTEYELGFIDFATVVAIARTSIREKYSDMSYNELCRAYGQIFGPEDNG
jgi:hypothetical protein